MDFITVEELRSQPASVWKKLAKAHELVVTRNGRPFALLTETSPTKLEDDLRALRRARTQVALDSMRAPRSGWSEAFTQMSQHQDDKLFDDDTALATEWDRSEWRW